MISYLFPSAIQFPSMRAENTRAAPASTADASPFGCSTVHPAALLAAALLERLQHLVEAEAADFLARREFLERHQELPDVLLRRHEEEEAVRPPAPVFPAMLGVFERVGAEV